MLLARAALAAFLLVAAANLASVVTGSAAGEWVTKPLLTVLLAVHVAAVARTVRGPVVTPLLIGLGFALGGDVALQLHGRTAFLVGLLLFLVMQVCYLVAFARAGAFTRLRARAWTVTPYALYWAGMNVWLVPQTGPGLGVPVLVYSALLAFMAATASCLGWAVGIGGLSFLLSDTMIALRNFAGVELPASWLVMATYALAQGLLATGLVRLITARSSATEASVASLPTPAPTHPAAG